ncbi:2-keto-4-pentenoate hydratase [Humitalea rosea]|uniref:2-keto-4-pentenoate hydratase n=1 Tax=Humitalea rosea TaxID=990373 RepID=A0A2W7I9T9_9PROT|nr:hypothetical protein [Humitalea rosea]PZW41855.1 2-keto-4-pentenoate hydratase [Humitalea rosea]
MRRPLFAACLALLPFAAAAACPDPAAVNALARSMLSQTPARSYGPGMSLADGQCAQDRLATILGREWGGAIGWKVGLTNAAAQAQFGVPHPLAGPIYAATLDLRSGATLPARFASVPVVESDLLVRIRDAGIATAGRDPVAILAHLDQVIPFIELPDLVLAPGETMDAANLLAIGVGARRGVVGEAIVPEATESFAARLGTMRVRLATDDKILAEAPGSALLGHPLNVIPWLVEDLARRGLSLRAGDFVSLGGFSPAVRAEAGQRYTATYTGLLATPVTVAVTLR